MPNSAYLVIKSPAVGENAVSRQWTYITGTTTTVGTTVHVWGNPTPDPFLDMTAGEHIIVVQPRSTLGGQATLVTAGSQYDVTYTQNPLPAAFQAPAGVRYTAYGVDNNALILPFNRADYSVQQIATTNPGCTPHTGTLVKAVLNQANGTITQYPLMDCVASMQVMFGIDTNGDDIPDDTWNTLAGLSPMQIKQQVKELRVYILAHEGTQDPGYTYGGPGNPNPVIVGSDAAKNHGS